MDTAAQVRRPVANPASGRDPARKRGTGPRGARAGVLLLLLLLAGAGWIAFQAAHDGHIFPGVRIGDLELGGMSRQQALARLQPWVQERSSSPMEIRGPEGVKTLTIAELGVSFDASAAVDAAYAIGRTGGFPGVARAQLQALLRGQSVDSPGLRVDRGKLISYLEQRARGIDRPVKDADLKVGSDLVPQVSASVVGRKLEVSLAADSVEKAISLGSASVDLPVAETQPKVMEKDLQEARAKLSTILSGPASLEFEGRRWTLSTVEIGDLLSLQSIRGEASPVISIRDEPLKKLVDKAADEIDQPKLNARYDWNGGNLKLIRQGQDGRTVDREKALTALNGAITSDNRTVSLPVDVQKGVGVGIDPARLGIKELVDSASTSFAGAVPEKAFNIKLAASRLNGVLLAPGDVFSFNGEVGPTTLKAGYQIGFGIASNGAGEAQTVPSVAGGICQVSTTLFHAVFWSGYEVDEQYPHMYWIKAYGVPPKGMIGLDATVDDPNLDFKFKNNTENYLLVQSRVEDNNVEFSLYGTKPKWKVDVEGPIITNVVKADPAPERQEEPSWPAGKELWVSSAGDGMDVKIIRRVTEEGGNVRTLTVRANYQPSRSVLMVGTGPAPAKSDSAAGEAPKPAVAPTPNPAPSPTPSPAQGTGSPGPTSEPAAAAPSPSPAPAASGGPSGTGSAPTSTSASKPSPTVASTPPKR